MLCYLKIIGNYLVRRSLTNNSKILHFVNQAKGEKRARAFQLRITVHTVFLRESLCTILKSFFSSNTITAVFKFLLNARFIGRRCTIFQTRYFNLIIYTFDKVIQTCLIFCLYKKVNSRCHSLLLPFFSSHSLNTLQVMHFPDVNVIVF